MYSTQRINLHSTDTRSYILTSQEKKKEKKKEERTDINQPAFTSTQQAMEEYLRNWI